MINLKKCSSCNLEKELSEFGTRKRKLRANKIKEYLNIYCKICENLKIKLWRKLNLDKVKKANGSARSQDRKKKWLKNNLDKRKKYEKQYYLNNIEQFRKNSQTKKCKENKRIYKKNRKHHDPIFKMRENISNAISKALKRGKSNKSGRSILKYLDYTIQDLKIHIENQFDDKMSWDNHGIYWHIDHITPQSDLPYTSMEDNNFKECWSLKNLRPLEAKRNMSDGGSRIRHK